MIFYPKLYLNNVQEITLSMLQQNQIKGLLLDVDNTLIDYNQKMPEGIRQWANDLKTAGIKLCILSNTNNKEKVEKVSKTLEIPYLYFAKKPLKGGFKKGKEKLQLEAKNIAVVGDQILTDIIGANRSKMFSILVKPIAEKDIWITKLKRPIEQKIIKKYQSKNADSDKI